MPTVTLFYNIGREYGVNSITFDLALEETHDLPIQVSKHRIEQGSEISDHIELPFQSGTLVGLVSNFSLKSIGNVSNRAQDVFSELEKLRSQRVLVTITTGLKVYTNVAVTGISTARNRSTGEALTFRVSFMQVRRVKLRTVQIEASINLQDMSTNQNRQAAPNADTGRTIGITTNLASLETRMTQ